MNESITIPQSQIGINLIMPIPNNSTESYGQKICLYTNRQFLSKKGIVKRELRKWIDGTYEPTHFISIQLPENLRYVSKENAITHLHNMMVIFERYLLKRHWNKKHLPFICLEEECAADGWHFHIFLNKREFAEQELKNAVFAVNIKLQLPSYCIDIRHIPDSLITTYENYGIKQIRIDEFSHFDSDRIILSHDLFNLPYKNCK